MSRILKADGLRGIAVAELSCELMLHIGRAAAQVIGRSTGHPPMFYVAHDPRRSADALEAALSAGICSGGGNVTALGVLPVAAAALLMATEDAQAGFVLTAEGSSYEYSGLRCYAQGGVPMSEEQLRQIESMMPGGMPLPPKSHRSCGTIFRDHRGAERYLRLLQQRNPRTCDEKPVERPLRIAVDCANGAVSALAAPLLRFYGMEVLTRNASPDGMNINKDSGVNETEQLAAYVQAEQLDAGFALDGSGERCVAVDANGELLDGDSLLAVFLQDAAARGQLPKNAVAATVMSNLGLMRFAGTLGVAVHLTQPAPRFVWERVQSEGLSLGGERGGYIFFGDMPAADGLCTALRICMLMQRTGRRLSELTAALEHDPQVSLTVRIPQHWREIWKNDAEINRVIAAHTALLGEQGRILVRELPREAAVQVLLEGRDFRQINSCALEIGEVIRARVEA